MNKFEEVVVKDIASIKTETSNCQKACRERHEHLDTRVNDLERKQEDLKSQLFDPKEGVVTMLNMSNAKQSVVTAISAFLGTTIAGLILGYVFMKAVHG